MLGVLSCHESRCSVELHFCAVHLGSLIGRRLKLAACRGILAIAPLYGAPAHLNLCEGAMTDSVAERVVATLASVKHVPRETITLASSLQDLGFDSLDVITMLFELEKEFEISIPDEEARSVRSARDIVEGVSRLLAAAAGNSAAPAD